MTTEHRPENRFATPLLPWFIFGGALLVYLFTLNHWITFLSLPVVAEVSGLNWQPVLGAPLFYILTLPIRWFPAASQPIALNIFSAICGALTLALLARSVMLLPHDRTRDQRQREQTEFSFLSIHPWLPPLLAVLACGLQITFWENSINASNEIIDVLLFAYLIRCLLEFRTSQRESWLAKLAFVYGLGTTNSWALIGFFPLFLAAIIWMKGIAFFQARFVGKMLLCGLAGLSLYLLLPIVAISTHATTQSFGALLHSILGGQKQILFAIPRWVPMLLSVGSLLPILLISIRWPSFQADLSATGSLITNLVFRLLHLVFFAFCLWICFDYQFSPRLLEPRLAFLTFYYLGALSIGYFAGYMLVVFGKSPVNAWDRPQGFATVLNKILFALVWVALLAVPA